MSKRYVEATLHWDYSIECDYTATLDAVAEDYAQGLAIKYMLAYSECSDAAQLIIMGVMNNTETAYPVEHYTDRCDVCGRRAHAFVAKYPNRWWL